jgi:hypothetical protein
MGEASKALKTTIAPTIKLSVIKKPEIITKYEIKGKSSQIK